MHQTIGAKPFDIALFDKTTHNPSFANLIDNFEFTHGLKDYCIPVNSYFPPQSVMDKLYEKMPSALKYYPSSNETIAEKTATFSAIDNPEWILAGNSSTEIISWLNSIFIKQSLFVPLPSFGRWVEEPQGLGIEVHSINHDDDKQQIISPEEYVRAVLKNKSRNAVICNPNNPTGTLFSREEILWILDSLTHLDNIIIDESFIDFSSESPPSIKNDVHEYANTWVLKSLGKNLGLHGLRMGYAISNEKNIRALKKHLPYWNVNGITEMLLSLIKNEHIAYKSSCLKTISDANYLSKRLSEISEFRVFPRHSNFSFVKLHDSINGEQLRNQILKNSACLIRNCGNKLGSTKQYFRIAARPVDDTDYLVNALKAEIHEMNRTQVELSSGQRLVGS